MNNFKSSNSNNSDNNIALIYANCLTQFVFDGGRWALGGGCGSAVFSSFFSMFCFVLFVIIAAAAAGVVAVAANLARN